MEPARFLAPGLRGRADQLSLVGRLPGLSRSRTSSGGGAGWISTTSHSRTSSPTWSGVLLGSPRRDSRTVHTKGLVPFEDSELDALLFFGRERERDHRGQRPRVPADRALRPDRRGEEFGAPCRCRLPVAPSSAGERRAGRASRVRRSSSSTPGATIPSEAFVQRRPNALRPIRLGASRRARRRIACGHSWALDDALACDLLLVLDQAEEYFLPRGGGRGSLVSCPSSSRGPVFAFVYCSLFATTRSRSSTGSRADPEPVRELPRLEHLDRSPRAMRLRSPSSASTTPPVSRSRSRRPWSRPSLDQTATGEVDLGEAGRGLAAHEG